MVQFSMSLLVGNARIEPLQNAITRPEELTLHAFNQLLLLPVMQYSVLYLPLSRYSQQYVALQVQSM